MVERDFARRTEVIGMMGFGGGGGQPEDAWEDGQRVPGALLKAFLTREVPSVVRDRSGWGSHGTVYSAPQRVAGKYSTALQYDGVDDEVRATLKEDIGAAWALEAWVKKAASSEGGDFLVSVGYPYLGLSLDNKPRISWRRASDNLNLSVTSDTAINDDEWHHIVGTSDGTTVRLYVDGVEVGSNAVDAPKVEIHRECNVGTNAFTSGRSASQYTEAAIDCPRIYGSALTADEVATHYAGGPIKTADLLLWFDFDPPGNEYRIGTRQKKANATAAFTTAYQELFSWTGPGRLRAITTATAAGAVLHFRLEIDGRSYYARWTQPSTAGHYVSELLLEPAEAAGDTVALTTSISARLDVPFTHSLKVFGRAGSSQSVEYNFRGEADA